MKIKAALLSTLLLAGCAQSDLQAAAATGAGQATMRASRASGPVSRNSIVPLVDAHQHSMSADAQSLVYVIPELPPITLPADLDALLRTREKISGAPPVGDLFADDAIILEAEQGRWDKGHERINRFMNFNPKNIHYIPKSYSATGSSGYIAGNLRVGSAGKDEANFLLGISKNPQGKWQISSEMVTSINPPQYNMPVKAERIIEVLDDAGIKYGVVLSVAYWYGTPGRTPPVQNQLAKTQAENDWTVAETAKYPDRLIPFCGVNPLSDYAVAELERCAGLPRVKGMKISLANARVQLTDPKHVEKLRQFFQSANKNRVAIVVHVSTPYSRQTGEILLNQIIPAAPDIPIQIAHLGSSDEVAEVFADAIAAKDPRTKNLYFDLTQVVPVGLESQTQELMSRKAALLRKIGLGRIFYGTDMALESNPLPSSWWKAITKLPLTDDELRDIADNIPPYLK